MPNHKLKRGSDWRCRREEYLRASGRNEDLIREDYETPRPDAKLVAIPGSRRRSCANEPEMRLLSAKPSMRPSRTIFARNGNPRGICQLPSAWSSSAKRLASTSRKWRSRRANTPAEFLELGEAMIQKYLAEAAPLIQPAAVESRVSGVIAGVKVAGYVDLLDIEGRIVDSKSTLKPSVGIAHDHRLQLTSYVMITPAASGVCRLDTVTKGRTVRLILKSFAITAQDRQYAETIYPMVQDSIRDGLFLPRRNSVLCSRRYCGFWRRCELEYGGTVRPD
jgi:hypothetical protein